VLSLGVKSDNRLYNEMEGKFERLYLIGDAKHTGRIADATRDAYDICRKL